MNKKEMPEYLGLKKVNAIPMSQFVFFEKIKNEPPHLASGDDADGYLVVYEDGYKSWSPKDVFEKAYRERLNFDHNEKYFEIRNMLHLFSDDYFKKHPRVFGEFSENHEYTLDEITCIINEKIIENTVFLFRNFNRINLWKIIYEVNPEIKTDKLLDLNEILSLEYALIIYLEKIECLKVNLNL